ncbi:MAG: oxidoreductase [Flavobacteriales bacterium]|nr:oxidoreductase [Flavobacteriales bacterium]
MNLFANTKGLDYELLDSGNGRKLERFGTYILDRPEVEAYSSKKQPEIWFQADYRFEQTSPSSGTWHYNDALSDNWLIDYKVGNKSLKFKLELSKFKHIGLFPEQAENWRYLHDAIQKIDDCRFLNLFAYTSAASIVAASAGADVTNVEALKQLSNWSKDNASLNKIENVRWLVEDARSFVKRAIRRGDKFNGVILDPPAFGHGSKGKRWILERHLEELIEDVSKILVPKEFFVIINTYSPKLPEKALLEILQEHLPGNSKIKIDQLSLKNESGASFTTGNLARITSL